MSYINFHSVSQSVKLVIAIADSAGHAHTRGNKWRPPVYACGLSVTVSNKHLDAVVTLRNREPTTQRTALCLCRSSDSWQ